MSLTPGGRLGLFEITSAIGAGGMGEVYRARDTKLNRDVAIKVLPAAFADDPERLARFTREAQTLASLNHPNIGAIYGIEEAPAASGSAAPSRALVMELVEGDDLSTLIARGPIPVADALPIARQIAEALDAAHEQGVVHRDLKPANIKVRGDGTVKVLDFGLAKAMDPAGASSVNPNVSHSPTLTHQGTQAGLIIGTAAYMAPEQAKGKAVDKRADIWAFGVVLYEMLTGKRAFKGEDVSETLASVLKDTLSMDALPATTPSRIKRLIERCVDRDVRMRLRDIGEARVELADPRAASDQPDIVFAGGDSSRRSARVAWVLAAVASVALAATWYRSTRPPVETGLAPVRFTIAPPEGMFLASASGNDAPLALSPDGTMLTFGARSTTETETQKHLWVRRLDGLELTMLDGTVGARFPFWSPDSRMIAFFFQDELRAVAATGGPVRTIGKVGISTRGGSWSPRGMIIFDQPGPEGRRLMRIAATGGEPAVLREPDRTRSETDLFFPQFLPDGSHFIYSARNDRSIQARVHVTSLDGGEPVFLRTADMNAVYASGHLLFAANSHLEAQRMDVDRLTLVGEAQVVANDFARSSWQRARSLFAASRSGVVAYQPNSMVMSELVLVDRRGTITRRVADDGNTYVDPAFSPDGRKLLVDRFARSTGDVQTWLFDLDHGTSVPAAPAVPDNAGPVWARDGAAILFSGPAKDAWGLYRQRLNTSAAPELLASLPSTNSYPTDISPDGTTILLNGVAGTATGWDVYALDSASGRSRPIAAGRAIEVHGRYSPDGRWIAYMSDESGRREIYVESTGSDRTRLVVSTGDGFNPRWRADSRELFFLQPGGLYTVAIPPGDAPKFGAPKLLFSNTGMQNWAGPIGYSSLFDVAPDGQTFALVVRKEPPGQSPISVIVNWPALVGAKESER